MTLLLEHAFEAVRALPRDKQDAIAHFLLKCAGVGELTAEEQASFEQSLARTYRREVAADNETRDKQAKHDS